MRDPFCQVRDNRPQDEVHKRHFVTRRVGKAKRAHAVGVAAMSAWARRFAPLRTLQVRSCGLRIGSRGQRHFARDNS
jgi:hypothetical protein